MKGGGAVFWGGGGGAGVLYDKDPTVFGGAVLGSPIFG